jgi:hypothetical protein
MEPLNVTRTKAINFRTQKVLDSGEYTILFSKNRVCYISFGVNQREAGQSKDCHYSRVRSRP